MSGPQIVLRSVGYALLHFLKVLALALLGAGFLLGAVKITSDVQGQESIIIDCPPVDILIAQQLEAGQQLLGDDHFTPTPLEPRHWALIYRGMMVPNYDRVTVLRQPAEDGNFLMFYFSIRGCLVVAVKQLEAPFDQPPRPGTPT